MSRSRRKKKHRKERRVTEFDRHGYNFNAPIDPPGSPPCQQSGRLPAGPPLVAGYCDSKDSNSPAVPSPDSALELHSISEWLARDAIARGEATLLRTSARVRGIQYVRKAEPDPVTPEKPCPFRTASIGAPTHADSIDNPEGCYTFVEPGKRPARPSTYRAVPKWITREMFMRPVVECLERLPNSCPIENPD